MHRINLFLIAALCYLFTSCEDLIDDLPQDKILVDAFFTNPTDAEAVLIGAYSQTFQSSVYTNFLFYDNRSSDDLTAPLDGEETDRVMFRPNMNSNAGEAAGLYGASYNALATINLAIEEVSAMPDEVFFNPEQPELNRKNEIVGEARFLRAFVYYHMTSFYGDIPLVTEYPKSENPEDYLIGRTPRSEIMEQVMMDLDSAELYLPMNHNALFIAGPPNEFEEAKQSKGRATKGAAMLMKARIFIMNQEWQRAIDKCRELIALGEYQLEQDYTQIFSSDGGPSVNQNSSESILEIQTLAGPGEFNNTGGYAWFHQDGARPRRGASQEAFNLFQGSRENPEDVRKFVSMAQVVDEPQFIYAVKYANSPPWWNPDNGDFFNFVPMRLSEAYLIIAEALNELEGPNQESLTIINTFRARAFNPDIPTTGIEPFTLPADQDAFRQMIREERRRELIFEGHAFRDMMRYDSYDGGTRAMESLGLDESNKGRVLFPIPQQEIIFYERFNKGDLLPQNPDY